VPVGATLQELIDRSSVAGLDGHRQMWPSGGFLFEALPAFGGMLKLQLGHDLSLGVDDDDPMMVFRPIKPTEVNQLLP